MSEIIKFIEGAEKALLAVRKVDRETNSNFPDMAVFLDSSSKKFLIDHKEEIKKLFDIRIQREFVSFIVTHIWQEKEGEKKGGHRFNR